MVSRDKLNDLGAGSDLASLLTLLKESNESAFEQIYDRYAPLLFNFVYAKLRHRESTEEIVQEIFVALWNNRTALHIQTTIEAYLIGAAKNKILSYIRSEKVRKRYAEEFTQFAGNQLDNSLLDHLNINDLQGTIHQAISELPEKCQVAFRMSRMAHAPIPQIAEEMNISRRTVENYISQALRHLRARLGELLVLATAVFF